MTKYKVLTPVDHDGERYEPGKSIELEDVQAKPLLAVGDISSGKGKGAAASAAADDDKPEDPAAE